MLRFNHCFFLQTVSASSLIYFSQIFLQFLIKIRFKIAIFRDVNSTKFQFQCSTFSLSLDIFRDLMKLKTTIFTCQTLFFFLVCAVSSLLVKAFSVYAYHHIPIRWQQNNFSRMTVLDFYDFYIKFSYFSPLLQKQSNSILSQFQSAPIAYTFCRRSYWFCLKWRSVWFRSMTVVRNISSLQCKGQISIITCLHGSASTSFMHIYL